MRDRAGVEQIKALANERASQVLAALGIRERVRAAGYISMCNPMVKDEHPSFTIWTRGGFVTWKYHSGDAQGDIIDLVSYLKGWWDRPYRGFPESVRFLEDLLGVKQLSPAARARDAARARAIQAQAKKRADEELARKRRRAFQMWLSAEASIIGTLAEVYLRGRGIDLRSLARVPAILRFLPSHKHIWEERGSPRDGEESHWPCLIAGCVDARGRIQAVHRTWLARDGRDKAPVKPQRKVWPDFAGLYLPLWRGASDLPLREACAAGLIETLTLTEGIEDGYSAVIGAPQYRTWAVISLSNLGNVPLPPCVDAVIVHRQNDWLKLEAVAAFEAGKQKIEASGRLVAEVAAYAGKDLNDTLRGMG